MSYKAWRPILSCRLENDDLAAELGLRPKRGVLLVGPPGTGKTTVGRALAHRLQSKFFLVDGTFISGTHQFYGRIGRGLSISCEGRTAMAGSIIISQGNVWSDSTRMLDRIALRTSETFSSECEKYKEEIFSPVEIFQLIGLEELDANGFSCFYCATTRAFEHFRDSGPRPEWPEDLFPGTIKAWSRLLDQLRRDPRCPNLQAPS